MPGRRQVGRVIHLRAVFNRFRLLTSATRNTSQAIEDIQAEVPPCPEVDELIEFIRAAQRGFIK